MDFSKLGSAKKPRAPTNPIKIFETLPSLEGTPNDLWRGQDKALSEWEKVRERRDVLITLNTGAGKTIVGLLIAQSLVNEDLENITYVCSTIDLVNQTSREAMRIGINHTTRVRGTYSNDLFETGRAFCITTYAALFNGLSSIRRNYFPSAIIFDDAHVAESLLRDAFTLRIDVQDDEPLFNDIANLFRSHFKDLNIRGRFADSLDVSKQYTTFVAPGGLYERSEQLLNIFYKHGVKNHQEYKYPFAWLEDRLDCCAAVFTRGAFELTPPFLPSLALDIFEQNVRRVYLSATLQSQTEFIRAFGRLPDKTISPTNDAGNGERLILVGGKVKEGFGRKFAKKLVKGRKAIVAVPDYARAVEWNDLSDPPTAESFSDALNEFREDQKDGAFILVSRVDGIDLPHDTCRIMIMDGVPSATSLLERYQWEWLRMDNVQASRVANRLAQLFGRINRGRNDYGAFLLQGDGLNKWIARDRNLALLPPLLQKQILIGREMQSKFKLTKGDDVIELVDRVLGRDEGWLDYYQREVKLAELDKDQLQRAQQAEPVFVAAAKSEAMYAAAMWSDDSATARRELEKTIDMTANDDAKLSGWHLVWLGAAYERSGDSDSAYQSYAVAMRRLNRSITLPRPSGLITKGIESSDLNEFGKSLKDLLGFQEGANFESVLNKLKDTLALIDSGTPNQAEAGVRQLGELLGFNAIRPDNDEGSGPDVLWLDEVRLRMIGFELKTEKKDPATYFKKDVGQGHDHLEWMNQSFNDYVSLGLLYVGPDGSLDAKANPSEKMALCLLQSVVALRNRIFALIEDLRKKTPLERLIHIPKITEEDHWDMEALLGELRYKGMAEL
ncbi:MAG: DEAD/DEAH box helicase family protein [Rhodobacteraceae bacterium]|nr:DEAD/DEAH box helicase family protein [Paracoccaceae bacterium]